MRLERGLPLVSVFGVLPARAVGGNVALCGLAEGLVLAPLLSLAALQGGLISFHDGVQARLQLPPGISSKLPGLR